jgi:IS4 transposase
MMLTLLRVEDLAGAKGVMDYYRRRWKCEESVRFLKSELGLERFALRVYEAFGPLLLLAMLAMSFLTWLQLHYASLSQWLASAAPGQHEIKFVYYRMLEWLQQQILPAPPRQIPP